MSNYNEMIGDKVMTDGGEYTIIAHVLDDGNTDDSINLYVGRADDGHCDLIARDNASMWVVGDADDAERNCDHWDAIEGRGLDMDAVRAIDDDLASWLVARYDEARRTVLIYRGDTLPADGYCHKAVIAPTADLDAKTIKAIWDDLPNECILEYGLGDDKVYAHFAPFDGDGDPAKDNRTIDGYEDCEAAYYVAPWEETHDGDGEWDLYNADGTEYEAGDEV